MLIHRPILTVRAALAVSEYRRRRRRSAAPRVAVQTWRLRSLDALVGVVHDVDLVGVTHAQRLLIVDDANVLTVVDVFHLIRGFPVAREHLIEMRQDLEA